MIDGSISPLACQYNNFRDRGILLGGKARLGVLQILLLNDPHMEGRGMSFAENKQPRIINSHC